MQCTVCGQEYGLTHNCPGITPSVSAEELAPVIPPRFPFFYYLREAYRIVRWDDVAVRRASRDKNALFYGVVIWAIGALLAVGVPVISQAARGGEVNWIQIALGIAILLPVLAGLTVLQFGVCHLLARLLFHATGSFVALLRALLLGQLVTWLIVVPYVGLLLAGLGGIAVLMIVFEEVDGIRRLQAFGISFVVGWIFLGISHFLFASR
jgi:hypothetical protein